MKRVLTIGLIILLIASNVLSIIYLNGRDYYVFHKAGQGRLWIETPGCELVIDNPYVYKLDASDDLELYLMDSNSPLVYPYFESSMITIKKQRMDAVSELEELQNSANNYSFVKEKFDNFTVYTIATLMPRHYEDHASEFEGMLVAETFRTTYLVFENMFIRIVGKDADNWRKMTKGCMG